MTRTIRRTIQLSPVQAAFRRSRALYRAFVGGRGAGKSWVGAYDLIRRAKRGRTYLVGSPTGVLLGDTTYPTFKAIAQDLGVWGGVKLTPYPNVKLTTGATVRFRTAEDPDKMRGPNLSGIWLDEASLMHEDAYKICLACLREDAEQGWMTATFTPKGLTHWTYGTFGQPRPNTELFRASTRQNPFNPPEFYANLKAQFAGLQAEQELEGAFINVDGAEWPAEYFPGEESLALANGENGIWFRDWPRVLQVKAAALDPSKGKGDKTGDYAAFVWGGLTPYPDGILYVDAAMNTSWPTSQLVEIGLDILAEFLPNGFAVEINQFQELLLGEFVRMNRERAHPLQLPFFGINNTQPKPVRIRTIGKHLYCKEVRFRAGSPGARLLVQQLRDWPCGEHDDGPDALAMCLTMLWHLLGQGQGAGQPVLARVA